MPQVEKLLYRKVTTVAISGTARICKPPKCPIIAQWLLSYCHPTIKEAGIEEKT